ncbi:MAG: ferritin-like domain-containing protein, partial [Cyanobacteria bacterium J06643_5]
MNQDYNIAGLDLPKIEQKDKLNRILFSALKKAGVNSVQNDITALSFWNAKYFNLDKVKIFQDSTPVEQNLILQLCSLGILEEA